MRTRQLIPLLSLLTLGCAGRESDGGSAGKPTLGPAGSPAASVAPTPAPSAAEPAPSAAAPTPNAAPAVVNDGPRVYAKSRFVWIHSDPNSTGWTGFMWLGGSVKLKDTEPKSASNCTKWYAIEPRGYVCVDGVRATLDRNDPQLVAMRPYAPNVASPWIHQYAESRGVVRYPKLPSEKEQRQREWDLEAHLDRIEKARLGGERHASLVGVDLTPAKMEGFDLGPLPSTVHEPRQRLLPLSTVAYSTSVQHAGRTWLLSADLMWVPKDRVVPYDKVTFRGVHLGKDASLPLAFFRTKDRAKFERGKDGKLIETAERFARLSHVELTGQKLEQEGEKYLETRDHGRWLKESDAVVPTPQDKTPWGAPVGGADSAEGPAGRRTWMEASVWQGWLIAYEGTKPIFVTLIAPGRGGTPRRGIDPIETASTPVGVFPITGKFATATMVAPGDFIHSDVPWAQNFHGPHALHGAYWHDDWGNRKSGGCVNVSPTDGKFLFDFTEPPIPDGWHGVRWRPSEEPATTFVVHD